MVIFISIANQNRKSPQNNHWPIYAFLLDFGNPITFLKRVEVPYSRSLQHPGPTGKNNSEALYCDLGMDRRLSWYVELYNGPAVAILFKPSIMCPISPKMNQPKFSWVMQFLSIMVVNFTPSAFNVCVYLGKCYLKGMETSVLPGWVLVLLVSMRQACSCLWETIYSSIPQPHPEERSKN